MSLEPDAVLKNASLHHHDSGAIYMVGNIWADRRGRFSDGTLVRTSPIVEQLAPNLYRTKFGALYQVDYLMHS